MQCYWEESIKEYLQKEKSRFVVKVFRKIKIYEDTSPDMIKLLIRMRSEAIGSGRIEHHGS